MRYLLTWRYEGRIIGRRSFPDRRAADLDGLKLLSLGFTVSYDLIRADDIVFAGRFA